MYTLGIDQSLTSTGICILDTSSNTIIRTDIFRSNNDLLTHQRIHQIKDSVYQLAQLYPINKVHIESLAFSSFGNATRDLAMLFGVLMDMLVYDLHLPVICVAPTTLKKAATGSGKATKQEMYAALSPDHQLSISHIKKTKGLYDITDAIHLALYSAPKVI